MATSAGIFIGNAADSVVVGLNPTCVWNPTLSATDAVTGLPANWPVGTTCTVEFKDFATAFSLTITGVVSGANISFSMSAAQSDSVPDGSTAHFYLDTSGNGTARTLWMSGAVVVGN
jgi:hypothetical protein